MPCFNFGSIAESLNEVTFNWPEAKSEGWIIDGFDLPDQVQSADSTKTSQGTYRVRLIQPQNDKFQIRLRARRPARGTDDVTFTLPRAKASSPVDTLADRLQRGKRRDGIDSSRRNRCPFNTDDVAMDQLTIPESLSRPEAGCVSDRYRRAGICAASHPATPATANRIVLRGG